MPDTKGSLLTLYVTAVDAADLFNFIDVSDTTMGVGGTNKRLTLAGLMGSPGPIGATTPSSAVVTALTATGQIILHNSVSTQIYQNNDNGVCIGLNAMADPNSSGVTIGFFAGGGVIGADGANNVRIGRHSGHTTNGVYDSVFMGHAAGQYATDAANSVIIGHYSGRNINQDINWHGFSSVLLGDTAAGYSVDARNAVVIGALAAGGATSNSVKSAVVIGAGAGRDSVTCEESVIIGNWAAISSTTSLRCVYIGNQVGQNTSRNNTLAIDSNPTYSLDASTCMIYGEFDNRVLKFNAATTVNGALTVSPANANVNISPSGTGTVTISSGAAGTMNNVAIGTLTPLAGSFTGLTVSQANLGVTTTNGLVLSNPTAAAVGAQQISPSIQWTGQGWKTTATAGSQQVDFRAYVLPIQGATSPSAQWTLQSQANGGGWTDRFALTSAGALTGPTSIVVATITCGASSFFFVGASKSKIGSTADGVLNFLTNAGADSGITAAAGVFSGAVTIGSGGTPILKTLSAVLSAFDCPSIAANGGVQTTTLTVTGATTGSTVVVSLPSTGINAGVRVSGYVSAADTVTIVFTNVTTAAIDPVSANYRVTVFNF